MTLTLPQGWLTQHPLGKEIIDQEKPVAELCPLAAGSALMSKCRMRC
ncbi:hypothetical protein ACNKHM_12105 [Shigella sonnei]